MRYSTRHCWLLDPRGKILNAKTGKPLEHQAKKVAETKELLSGLTEASLKVLVAAIRRRMKAEGVIALSIPETGPVIATYRRELDSP